MSRPEIVEDVIAAAAAVPQSLDRLSEEARAAWAGQLAADVAAERRAAGVTVAPEAALHLALQARTDELERVRAERDSALADLLESATCLEALEAERRTVLAMVEHHAGGSPRLVDEVRASLRSLAQDRDAAVDEVVRLVRERDEAQAALAEARAENASLLAVVPPGTHVARVEWGVHAEVTRQRDEILRLTRERDEARATCSELRQAVATIEAAYDRAVSERDAAHEQVATMQAGYEAALSQAVIERDAAVDEVVRLVRARDEARASITRFAEAAAAHDANADVFVDDEYHISTRALVEEFCREHGHPLAHEWATAKINAAPDGGAPTAPDVALPCAPAAGAADPLRLSGLAAPRPLATWWPASDTRTRTR